MPKININDIVTINDDIITKIDHRGTYIVKDIWMSDSKHYMYLIFPLCNYWTYDDKHYFEHKYSIMSSLPPIEGHRGIFVKENEIHRI